MTLYVSEYYGTAQYYRTGGLIHAPRASYSMSSAAAVTPQAGTDFIGVTADAGTLVSAWLASTVTLTSTNALRIPANVSPIFIAVSTKNIIQAQST